MKQSLFAVLLRRLLGRRETFAFWYLAAASARMSFAGKQAMNKR